MSYDQDGNWTPDEGDSYGDSYTYATPDELTASEYNAPNSGIDYANNQDLADSGYLSYADPSELSESGYNAPMSGQYETGSYATNSFNSPNKLIEALKSLGGKGSDALTKALSSPSGIASLAQMLLPAIGLFNKKFATAPQEGGYIGPGVNMALKANRGTPNIPEYVPYAGKGAKGNDFGISNVTYAAEGGIMGLAKGGHARAPRYLDGSTDGMADKINTSIDDKQPAKLSHGEFVIPADVVSHLGNGNSSAGAKELYKMMERVRKARTGNSKQGKQINPEKFTPGGIAGYAGGGAVAFAEGGTTSYQQNLSNWAGPYVTDMLSKSNALANTPTPVYTGQLTAGNSPLQNQAFGAASNLGGAMGPVGSIQSYMNPYMQGAVDVQNTEARRNADISRVNDSARMVQAGAFGGSRQAIMEAEGNRNLATLQNANQATGMNTAWNNAVNQQKNVADYNLKATGEMADIGAQQRNIEQQGIDALKSQFDQQAADPYKRLQFQQSMLKDLPISTRTDATSYSQMDNLSNLINQLVGGAKALT